MPLDLDLDLDLDLAGRRVDGAQVDSDATRSLPEDDNAPDSGALPLTRYVMDAGVQTMERAGLEPATPSLQSWCSPN